MKECVVCIYCNGKGIYVPASTRIIRPPAACPLCDGLGLIMVDSVEDRE